MRFGMRFRMLAGMFSPTRLRSSLSRRCSLRFGAACGALGLSLVGERASADVFISEYVEGASNDKALELYNSGDLDIDLASGGYGLRVYFNGNVNVGTSVALAGSLPARGVFVLAHSGASPALLALAAQTTGSALWNGDDAIEIVAAGTVIDSLGQVGVDPGTEWAGGGENDTLRRKSNVCSGDADSSDAFDAALAWDAFPSGDLSGLGAAGGACSGEEPPVEEPPTPCGAPATPIHDVQGPGAASPIAGTLVSIEGVVTGDFQGSSGLNGFFVQEEAADSDADPGTSEGVFVFDSGSTVGVGTGDVVRVLGRVTEFNELTELNAVESVQLCASGAGLPPAPLALPIAASAELEALEGMLVSPTAPLIVNDTFDLARFGEVVLAPQRSFQPTQLFAPGADAIAAQARNDLGRLQLDDGSNVQNPASVPYLGADSTLRAGDRVDTVTGVLGFGFGAYELHPTAPPSITRANPRELSPPDPGGRLHVASFNVLNYFTTLDTGQASCGPAGGLDCRGANSAEEFGRQRTKIIEALASLNAEVVGLLELQNDATASIADLVAGLDARLGAGTYRYVDTGTIGTDAIKVGLLYDPAAVEPLGSFALLDTSVDPAFIDTLNRPVLAQSFTELATGEVFTVAVNHLKSKGSACDDVGDPDVGDGQGNCNLTRRAAVEAELRWLATDPTGSGDPDVLAIGDFNAYALEDPITTFTGAGYSNLIAASLGGAGYSFVFEGQAGYLDHALGSAALAAQVTGTVEWHINADEPRFLDYNTEFNPPGAFQPNAFRSSDHDPLVVGLDLGEAPGASCSAAP